MPHRCVRLLLCLGAVLAATEARSAVGPAAESALLDLSLDDLLALEVSGVGLSAEAARGSAAIVDVVTRKEWEAMGARTLVDVVALLPGTRVLQRSTFTNAFTSLHGTAINDNDNHLLILVNGLPWRTSSVGGSNRLLYDAFPLAVVERVELVRGQTVTLHGSNAVAGILNIVVRGDAASEVMGRVSNQVGVDGALSMHWGEGEKGLRLTAAQQQGLDAWAIPDGTRIAANTPIAGELAQRGRSLSLSARSGRTAIDLLGMDSLASTIGTFSSPTRPRAQDRSALAQVQHAMPVGAWVLHASGQHGWSRLDYDTFKGWSRRSAARVALEAPADGRLRGWFGTQYESATGQVDGLLPRWSEQTRSVFAQAYFDVRADWTLGAGLQWQRIGNGFSDVTPQASLVWAPASSPWHLKAVSGRTFRNPGPAELFSSASFQRGNPALVPERGQLDALEVAYASGEWAWSGRLFRQRLADVIVLVSLGAGQREFRNLVSADIAGSEVQLRWRPTARWDLDASWQHIARADDTLEPRDIGKLQLAHFADGWSAGVAVESAGAAATRSTITPVRPALNLPASGYAIARAHVSADVGAWFGRAPERASITVSVENLTGEDVRQPSAGAQFNTLPHRSDRRLWLGVGFPL